MCALRTTIYYEELMSTKRNLLSEERFRAKYSTDKKSLVVEDVSNGNKTRFIKLHDLWSILSLSPEWNNISTANIHLGHLQFTIDRIAAENIRLRDRNKFLEKECKREHTFDTLPKKISKQELKAKLSTTKDFFYFWEQDPNITTFSKVFEKRFKKSPVLFGGTEEI